MSYYPKILVSNANNNNSLNVNILSSLRLPSLNSGAVFYNGSYYFVGGNTVVQSPDAINWLPPTAISGMSTISNFAWNTPFKGTPSIKPLTIACGEGNNTLAYSQDGIYWNGIGKSIFTTRANKAVWNGVLWTAVGTGGFWVATSYDGITWTGRDQTLMTEGYDIAWNGSVFVAAGYGGQTPLVASVDGVNWYGIPSSAPIFSIGASSISWTGKAWLAYGSGGNTTAVSNEVDAWIWNATSQQNLAIMDASSIFWQTGYPQVDTSNITASSIFSQTYGAFRACDNSMNLTTSTEWRSNSGSYDITTGINKSAIVTTYNGSLTASGEWIQIKNDKSIVAKYYHLSWYIDNFSQQGYAVPKEYYLLGSNNGSTWNRIDYNNINYTLTTITTTTASTTNLIKWYKFETTDVSGLRIANYSSGTPVYDASFSVSNLISTTNYKFGSGALSITSELLSAITASGQYVNISPVPATSSTNITCAFWANLPSTSTGYNPFFSIGNGQGNNVLEFGSVGGTLIINDISGTTVGTPSFSNYTNPWTNIFTLTDMPFIFLSGMAISADATKIVWLNYSLDGYDGYMYFSRYNSSSNSWSPVTRSLGQGLQFSSAVALSADGNRGVMTTIGGAGALYFFTWDGSNYSTFTRTLETSNGNYRGIDLTSDGKRLVVANSTGYICYADWNGTNYGKLIQTLDTNLSSEAVAISYDGYKLAYGGNNGIIRYSTWNGSNYTSGTVINTTRIAEETGIVRKLQFSSDSTILYCSTQGTANGSVFYTTWNGTGYNSTFTPIPITAIPANIETYGGLCITSDNDIYLADYNTATVYKTRVTIPNVTQLSSIYNTSVNDGTWRHYTLSIDNTGTYKVYINGILIYTSPSGLVFPQPIARNIGYIGKSVNHSYGYFNGQIDDFLMYNRELTQTEINTISSSVKSTVTNTSQNRYFVKLKNISSNQTAYQYYRLVIPSIIPGIIDYTRISEFDIFQENPNTTILNRFIKPIITKTHVLHPTSIIPFTSTVGKQTIYQITDLQCNVLGNTIINNGNFTNGIINGAGSQLITSSCFDGQNLIVTLMRGNVLYISNNSLNTNLLFDMSINGNLFTKNITGNVYSSCFNGQRIILGGTGGNVITYSSSLDKTPNAVFNQSINANNLFTSVYGVSSNPGYGFVYSPNRIYFDPGEKVSIVTPKSYNKNLVNNTTISMNLTNSSILQQVTLPTASYLFSAFGPPGPTGIGPDGANGPDGTIGPTGSIGPTGFIGATGTIGISPTGITGFIGPTGIMGLTGITGNTGPIGYTGLEGDKGFSGTIGPTGKRGDTDYQTWVLSGNSGSAYINGNVSIGTNISTTTLDISGNMKDSGLLILNRLQTRTITSNTIAIGKNTNVIQDSRVLDISGNVLIKKSLFINKQPDNSGSPNNYIVDVSGGSRVFSLYSNKNYSFVFLPTSINANNVVVDYSIGDTFIVDASSAITNNFACVINNLPIIKVPFASFNIVLIINYTNTNIDRYYCNSLVINGSTYYPNFNGGNPTAITGLNLATNTYIQKFSILCVNSSIWKLFCESENYTS